MIFTVVNWFLFHLDVVTFDNPEVASFLQSSSSIESLPSSLVRVNSLKRAGSQDRHLIRQKVREKERCDGQSVSQTPSILSSSMINSLNSVHSNSSKSVNSQSVIDYRSERQHFCLLAPSGVCQVVKRIPLIDRQVFDRFIGTLGYSRVAKR